MTNKEKLLSIASPANSETLDGIKYREENSAWLRESRRVAIKVLMAIKDKGLSQKDLAQKMNVSPQYISKLVKGKENLTLETLVKLQNILNITLLAGSDIQQDYSKTVEVSGYMTPYQLHEFIDFDPLMKAVGNDY